MVKKKESDIGLSLLLGNYDDDGGIDKDLVTSLGGITQQFGFGLISDEKEEEEEQESDGLISDDEESSEEYDESRIPSRYILSNENDENPILRFSELFRAKESKKLSTKAEYIKGLISRIRDTSKTSGVTEEEDDDEDVFFENETRVLGHGKKIVDVLSQEKMIEHDLEMEEVHRVDTEQAKQQYLDERISLRCPVDNVDQVFWENDIVWDYAKKGQEDEKTKLSTSSTLDAKTQEISHDHALDKQQGTASILGLNSIFSQDLPNHNKINQVPDLSGIPKLNVKADGEWGSFDEEEKEQDLQVKPKPKSNQKETPTPNTPATQPTSNPSADVSQEPEPSYLSGGESSEVYGFARDDTKKPKRKYTRRKKKDKIEDSGNNLLLKLSKRTTNTETANEEEEDDQGKFINEKLLNCDWMDSIYWDDVDPKVAPNTKLILDMNDKSMFFTEMDNQAATREELIDAIEHNIFNISNDTKYEGQNSKDQTQKTGAKKHTVRHSQPALRLDSKLYRTHIPDDELRRLHHRKTKFKANEIMPVLFRKPKKEKKKSKKRKDIEKKQDLSANDHRVILMEYVEERPALLNNVGMGTMIMNYYKKPNSALDTIPECEDGVVTVVESEDVVPFISNTLVDGQFFTTTENNMFRAQIFSHNVKSTDFLLCTRKSSNGGTKFYIREIPRAYTVGHTQPQVDVTPPRTRSSESYTNNRLTMFIYRCFLDQKKKGRKQLKIKIDDIKEAFPDFPHQTIRERLKALATYDRGSGVWTAHPSKPIPPERELCNLVSPEMVCINESMLSGDLRLNDKGIDDEASMVAFELSFARVEQKYRDCIRYIEREKIELPWDKTNNFHLCFKGGKEGVKLQLLSVVHQNITNPDKLKQLVDETEKKIQSEIEEILPSMTDTEAKKILLKNKHTEEQLKNMTRADRKMNARKILKQQGYQPGVEYNHDILLEENAQGAMDSNAIDSRKNAKDIARINIFKEVLQDIYFREAMKLEHGLNFYETPDEVIDQLVEKKLGRLKGDKELELEKMMNSVQQRLREELEENTEADTGKKKRGRKSKQQTQPNLMDLGKKYYVKKTKFITNDDGTYEEKVEYIRNPAQVSYYISVAKGKRRTKHFLGATEDEVLLVGPRERGRLQAMSRQYKKKFRSDKQTASEKLTQEKKKRTTAIKNASVTTTRKQQTKKKRLKREQKKEQEIEKKEKRAEMLKRLDTNKGGVIIEVPSDSKKKKEKSSSSKEKKRKGAPDGEENQKKKKK